MTCPPRYASMRRKEEIRENEVKDVRKEGEDDRVLT